MAMILIKCPATGKPISTGMKAPNRQTFESNRYSENGVSCPYCNNAIHVWDGKDAWLEGEPISST